MKFAPPAIAALAVVLILGGCSIKRYAIRQVGASLNSESSVFESDEDIELVGDALPFSLKFMESLLAEVPGNPDLLISACRGFTVYANAYVDFEGEKLIEEDLAAGREVRDRARRLYLRGLGYCLRGLDGFYPGYSRSLASNPAEAAAVTNPKRAERDVPLLYWTAASLGLAISLSKDDPAMLARLPEVEALIDRAAELDPEWDSGALHEFQVSLSASRPGVLDREKIDEHFRLAENLSGGRGVALYVAYAEAVAIPEQDLKLFRTMLDKALAIDPDGWPERRLANLIAQRRARWLASRTEDLFLVVDDPPEPGAPQ